MARVRASVGVGERDLQSSFHHMMATRAKDWHERLGSGVHEDAIIANPLTERFDGAKPRGCWRSLARSPALNGTIRWRSGLQILNHRMPPTSAEVHSVGKTALCGR